MSDKKEFQHVQEFKLPKMGESITEGTIIEWHINEGQAFNEGDVLLEVATDKVDNEVPAPFSGILISKNYENGDVVKIGAVIATLEVSETSNSQEKNKSTPKTGKQERDRKSTRLNSSHV